MEIPFKNYVRLVMASAGMPSRIVLRFGRSGVSSLLFLSILLCRSMPEDTSGRPAQDYFRGIMYNRVISGKEYRYSWRIT